MIKVKKIVCFSRKSIQRTHFCCNLAWVFFKRSSSTITDCLLGSTTRPFIWNPFIRLAVLKIENRYGVELKILLRNFFEEFYKWFYFEKTPLSDLMSSFVCILFFPATADFRMYCFPITLTMTDPLFRYSTS